MENLNKNLNENTHCEARDDQYPMRSAKITCDGQDEFEYMEIDKVKTNFFDSVQWFDFQYHFFPNSPNHSTYFKEKEPENTHCSAILCAFCWQDKREEKNCYYHGKLCVLSDDTLKAHIKNADMNLHLLSNDLLLDYFDKLSIFVVNHHEISRTLLEPIEIDIRANDNKRSVIYDNILSIKKKFPDNTCIADLEKRQQDLAREGNKLALESINIKNYFNCYAELYCASFDNLLLGKNIVNIMIATKSRENIKAFKRIYRASDRMRDSLKHDAFALLQKKIATDIYTCFPCQSKVFPGDYAAICTKCNTDGVNYCLSCLKYVYEKAKQDREAAKLSGDISGYSGDQVIIYPTYRNGVIFAQCFDEICVNNRLTLRNNEMECFHINKCLSCSATGTVHSIFKLGDAEFKERKLLINVYLAPRTFESCKFWNCDKKNHFGQAFLYACEKNASHVLHASCHMNFYPHSRKFISTCLTYNSNSGDCEACKFIGLYYKGNPLNFMFDKEENIYNPTTQYQKILDDHGYKFNAHSTGGREEIVMGEKGITLIDHTCDTREGKKIKPDNFSEYEALEKMNLVEGRVGQWLKCPLCALENEDSSMMQLKLFNRINAFN